MGENFYQSKHLASIAEVAAELLQYDRTWVFRGQARENWVLGSTLERLINPWNRELAETCEKYSLRTFQKKAHHYLSHDILPESKLGLLSLMQHHGVPTRLLDFTESPFIALFFAFDGVAVDQDSDPVVWALNYKCVMKSSIEHIKEKNNSFKYSYREVMENSDTIFKDVVDVHAYDVLWVTEPGKMNLRLERQAGSFVLSGNPRKRIVELLTEIASTSDEPIVHKIIIPAKIKQDVYKALIKMGLTNARLYSGIDGLAKDIKNELQHQVSDKVALHKMTSQSTSELIN